MASLEFKRVRGNEFPEVESLLSTYNPSAVIQGRYYSAKEGGTIKGVVGVLWRSWYLTEIRHLYVKSEFRRMGIGTFLVRGSLKKVKTPLVCCTVRDGNEESLRLFEREGFAVERTFVNPETGNRVSLLMRLREE